MISNQNKTITNQTYTVLSLIVICLAGCGGGGEGGGNSSQVASATLAPIVTTAEAEVSIVELVPEIVVDYSPNPEKLSNTAETSAELYAESNFNFDSFKNVTFDINAIDNLDQPMSNVMLSISVIDADITQWDDPKLQDKSLITKVFTDGNGQVNITLEIAKSVSKVLLELNTLGVENDVILNVDETGVVIHSFEQN